MSNFPGIVGVACESPVGEDLHSTLDRMIHALRRSAGGAPPSVRTGTHAALASVARDGDSAEAQTAAAGESFIALDGELYGSAGAAPGAGGDARRLLDGYLARGPAFLAELEGRFAAAIWDAERRRCVLVTDKFGTKPLYVAHVDGRLALASRIASLLALSWLPRDLNRRGLAEFFAFGQLWNEDTFLEAVRCLPPATVAVFDAAAGTFRQERYWRPRAASRRDETASLAALDATFQAAVDDRTAGPERFGLSLSGGLDARTVLAYMRPGSATCLSMGMEGSLDRRSAERLAELAQCDFRAFVLDGGFLGQFQRHLEHMVDLTDGHYLSQCIIMPTLPVYRELGVEKLFRGHAGELVHLHKAYNFSIDDGVARLSGDRALHDWLAPRLQGHLTAGVDEPILAGVGRDEFQDLVRGALDAGLAETTHWDHPVDRVSQLFLDQRTHRETAMSLAKIGSVVDVRVPYLDGRFVEAVFATPVELRTGEQIQTSMLRRRRPEFLRPANSNTGAPVGASAAWRTFCYYRMRILAKLGVRGFQPYERLGLWLRQDLRPTVERILLSPACLDRGVLAPDAVRSVVRRHLAGESNHTYLIMAMMIVETGFRRLWDSSGDDAPQDSPAPRVLAAPVAST